MKQCDKKRYPVVRDIVVEADERGVCVTHAGGALKLTHDEADTLRIKLGLAARTPCGMPGCPRGSDMRVAAGKTRDALLCEQHAKQYERAMRPFTAWKKVYAYEAKLNRERLRAQVAWFKGNKVKLARGD